MNIYENLWKLMNIYDENTWKPGKCTGYICFEKRRMGYILYSKNINASQICPPKRNILFQQRKYKSGFSGKHGLWFVKCLSKSWILWNHEIIPRSIQTFWPSRFLIKPQEKISCWQKCWNPFFPKVWDSFLATYSIICHNSCGNFNANSIQARSKWSQGSRTNRIFKQIMNL